MLSGFREGQQSLPVSFRRQQPVRERVRTGKMNITEIRIRLMRQPRNGVVASASVTIDSALVIHEILVVEQGGKQFLSMPSRRCADGLHRDLVHPAEAGVRRELTEAVLLAYRREAFRQRMAV